MFIFQIDLVLQLLELNKIRFLCKDLSPSVDVQLYERKTTFIFKTVTRIACLLQRAMLKPDEAVIIKFQ